MTSRVAEMARQAAAEVRTRGLAKGRYQDDDGCMCSAGLIRFVDQGTPFALDLSDDGYLLLSAVRSRFPTSSIPRWNDAPERTAEDVALMFERVAEQFESPTQPRQSA